MEVLLLIMIFGGGAWLYTQLDASRRDVGRLRDHIDYLQQRIDRLQSSVLQLAQDDDARTASDRASPEPTPSVPSTDEESEDQRVEVEETAPDTQPARAKAAEPDSVQTLSEPVVETETGPETEREPQYEHRYEQHTEEHASSGFTFDFEDIFGRRLPIWAGGIALAIAGIFLVRYSIEAGLITPVVRVLMSFAFGLALLGGAEAAFRFEDRVADPRVRQSLAGAGIATLYGAFYLAGTAYGMIGATAAFIGLAFVTAAAIALSFRFGLPCGLLGLVGGFAAPLMVDSDTTNIPLLAFYLALVAGGLSWTGRKQGRPWFAYAALAAGLGWGVLMLLTGLGSLADFAALGLYLIVLGTVLPAFLHSSGGPSIPQLAAGSLATLQMAVLVDNAGYDPLTWGLYLLIGAALSGLGWRFAELRPGASVAALIGLWLMLLWPDPASLEFAIVACAMTGIFALVPLAIQWRQGASLLEIAQLTLVPLAIGAICYVQFGEGWGDAYQPGLAAVLAGLALVPAASLALMWKQDEELPFRPELIVLAGAHALVFAALLLVSPPWIAPAAAALPALALVALVKLRHAEGLIVTTWASIAIVLIALAASPQFEIEATRLVGSGESVELTQALLRWSAAILPVLVFSVIARDGKIYHPADGLAAVLVYGLVAQIVPADWLAWCAALGALTIFFALSSRLLGWITALTIAALWTIAPIALWFGAGLMAMIGTPFFVDDAVTLEAMAQQMAPFALAGGVIAWRAKTFPIVFRVGLFTIVAILALASIHSLYKLAWEISSLLRFEQYGMGERTLWQVFLIASGITALNLWTKPITRTFGMALIALGLAHFVWFTLLLHNPLWSVQHVGPTPVANWLSLAYFTAMAGLVWSTRELSSIERFGWVTHTLTMGLIALLSLSLLRQIFAGSVLIASPIGPNESLLISLLGIVLALGFLAWGSRQNLRSWRIGSLVFMLLAVLKVFLVDAAGLEGLLRIASFMALGFSLIGIGWFYSRQLKRVGHPEADSS
jgi:uncharacterized membrane protein